MVDVGAPESVTMQLTGHKTRHVFGRYHSVIPSDPQKVARELAGTFPGTMNQVDLDDHHASL
jgi:hypothetical protein